MAFFRNLFQRSAPSALKVSSEPLAFYLGGDGRMQAIKAGGYLGISGIGRTGLGYVVTHAEQYARAAIASVWAANCINLRADTIARMDWLVRNRKTQKTVDEHPLTQAIQDSTQNIMRRLEWSQMIWGETFIKPLSNEYGYYSGLHHLNNLDMEVDTSKGYVSQFRYNPAGAGRMLTFTPRELVFMKTDNPFDDYRGLSKFEHVMLEIDIDQHISRTTRAFYANDARPGLLLIPEMDMTIPQATEFMEYWNSQFKGSDNAGKTTVVPRVIKEIREFQRAPALDDVELRESTRREICAAFKVPLSMAGAWDDATYQSLPEQRKFFYEETIIPQAEQHARDLTQKLLPFFDDSGENEVFFNADNVLSLVENVSEKVDIATKKLTSGAYTINEVRHSLKDDPIQGGDIHIMQSGWIPVRSAELASYDAPNSAPAPEENPALPAPQTEQDVILPAASRKQSVSAPAYAYIPLANNIDILRIQRRLKERLTDSRIEWQAAPTLHVTLCFADNVSDTAIPNLADVIHPQQMELTGIFLDVFETPEGKALHIRFEDSSVLSDVQASVYMAFEQNADGLSEYSSPSVYKPHVTLAYLPNDIPFVREAAALTVLADTIMIGRDDYDPILVLKAPQYIKHNHHHEPILYVPDETIAVKTIHDEALSELRAWQKFYANGTAVKRDFNTYMISDDIAFEIRASLLLAGNDSEVIKGVFKRAEVQVALKQADAVRTNFELEIKTLISIGRRKEITQVDFIKRLKAALYRYGNDALRAGLADGGVIIAPDEPLETDDAATFASIYAEQASHAKGLSAQVYEETLTDSQAFLKPRQWWGKSGLPFYDAGLLSAAQNQMVEFAGSIEQHSCGSCRALVGQRHRRRLFAAYGFMPPYGVHLECGGGGLCAHKLIAVNGRSRGNLQRVPKAIL